MTTRRLVVRNLACAALGVAAPGFAQTRPLRVSWFSFARAKDGSVFLDELRQGLRKLGYVEGQNLVIGAFGGSDALDRVREVVSQMLAWAPNIIVAQGVAVIHVKEAAQSIPVVFGYSGDPIEAGLVQSLPRPGGNMTGISYMALELVGKRLEILRDVMPGLKRVAILTAPQHPGDKAERRVSAAAAASLGIATTHFEARGAAELYMAMAAMEKAGCEAVVMFPVHYVITDCEPIAEWAIRHRLPTMSGWAQFADGGNLMSYGPNLRECSARMALFVDKIAKGQKPAGIPVELPTRVEFVLNLRAAKALGVNVPPAVALQADRVIT